MLHYYSQGNGCDAKCIFKNVAYYLLPFLNMLHHFYRPDGRLVKLLLFSTMLDKSPLTFIYFTTFKKKSKVSPTHTTKLFGFCTVYTIQYTVYSIRISWSKSLGSNLLKPRRRQLVLVLLYFRYRGREDLSCITRSDVFLFGVEEEYYIFLRLPPGLVTNHKASSPKISLLAIIII